MSELPPGWTPATGADVFEFVTSGSRGWAQYYSDEGATFVRIGNLDHGTITLDLHDVQRVRPPDGAEGERTRLKPNDVLVSITAELGMVGLVPTTLGEAYINQHIALARPRHPSEPRFLAWYMASEVDGKRLLQELRRGATKAGLGLDDIRSIEFPLAPLSEQKRIADKLDALLARVDACRGRLDRVPGILKRFRQSLLAAATSGELTREWREERGLDLTGWEATTVATLLEGKPRNGYSPRAVERPTAVKSLTLTATTTGTFRGEHSKYIDEEIPPESHLWLVPGDILIQRANTLEYVGVSAIFDGPSATFIYPDLMMKCRANARVVTPFLHCLLSSEPVRAFFRENATGTAGNMPKINQQTVLAAPVVLPPLNEQREVVRRMETLLPFVDRLDRRYETSRKLVDKLTPSVLAKAFRGELVPQDPNDEPAPLLLARLRTRPDSAGDTGKPKRGGTRGSRAKPKADTNMLTRKDVTQNHLTTILKERGALTAEALWSASKLEIDDFYDQLKDEVAQGLLCENRGDSPTAPRLLEAAA